MCHRPGREDHEDVCKSTIYGYLRLGELSHLANAWGFRRRKGSRIEPSISLLFNVDERYCVKTCCRQDSSSKGREVSFTRFYLMS